MPSPELPEVRGRNSTVASGKEKREGQRRMEREDVGGQLSVTVTEASIAGSTVKLLQLAIALVTRGSDGSRLADDKKGEKP